MPGGKLEEGESARDCVVRETKEELNISILPQELVAIGEVEYELNNTWVFLYYSAKIINGIPTPMEENKTLDTAYVSFDKIHMNEKIVWIENTR